MRHITLFLPGLALFGCLSLGSAFAQVPAPSEQPQRKPVESQAKPVESNSPAPSPTPVEAPPEAIPPAGSSKGKNIAPKKPQPNAKSAFIIGPEDVLGVRVWEDPSLSGTVTVGPDGMISLQLIHEVKAAGLTPTQLEAELTKQFKEYRNNPDVSVQVLSIRSRKYSIQGGVGRTGSFPLTGEIHMLEALAGAGGFKEFAKPSQTYILRTKPDGTTEKLKFNYKDVSHGKHMETNILVQNGDQIFVPE